MMTDMNDRATRQRVIQRYIDAETSVAEEKALFDFYSHTTEPLSADEEPIRQLVLSTVHLADDSILSDEKVKEFDHIMAERERRASRMKLWPWLAAACVAAFVAVLLAPPELNGRRGNDEGGSVLSMEVKNVKEDAHRTPKPQDTATHVTSSIKPQPPTINTTLTLQEGDQSDLVSVENMFGLESRPDPLEEYTALEEKLQRECDEVFLILNNKD
ncbi:MAG: hypothetical protein IJK42_13055 [Prevotella sp.]|nr:hypothetical protein [Prevotella sp.]MBQ6210677.1 hypothetical protein [Prevotella sp.]